MPLLIVKSPKKMQALAESIRADGKTIGLVPTMGALHDGHLKLVDIAGKKADIVIVSIFVNPAQFAPGEDFGKYPRSFKSDCEKIEKAGARIVFHPSTRDIYPEDYSTFIDPGRIGSILDGARRPGHFKGVATICAKLFNITKSHIAVFGQKDGQQLAVIKRMVRDLNLDIDIIKAPIVRTAAGVAMSSRHSYLSEKGLEKAKVIRKSLLLAKEMIAGGERSTKTIENRMRKLIQAVPETKVDYISFDRWDDLEPMNKLLGRVMISLVTVIEGVRLLDNEIIRIEN